MKAAVKKLNDEMKKVNTSYVLAVGQFLLQHLEGNPSFAEKINTKEKSIAGSLEAMRKVAEKQKVGNVAVLSDKEGFAAVLDYFNTVEKQPVVEEEKKPVVKKEKPAAKEEKKVEVEPEAEFEFDFLN